MFVKKLKKFVKCISISLSAAVLAGAFFSCDIGLGGAVDTLAPIGEIKSPGDDAIIRDAFAVKGTWGDDGFVGQITVSFRNTSTNAVNTYNANIALDGSWLCPVNPFDPSQPLVDGNYVATVAIYDAGGHVSNLTRSFTIDNTAPVVILQRPSTIITDSYTDTYGQKFTIQGQAADDSNINRIDVNVYSDPDCTNFLKTISLSNVPASINLDVATFSETIENDYSVIYGHTTKSGAETRYCKIFAYDGAQRYPVDGSNQSAEDTYGNCQTEYYLYDEISSSVLSKYKVNEIYTMFSGTYVTNAATQGGSAENVSEVKGSLSGKSKAAGKFALNPTNNPTFTVSGKNQLARNGSDFTGGENDISTGNEVVIEVSPGLDGIPLNEGSLRVYFVECDANGNRINDVRYYPTTESEKSGSGYKFKTPVSTGLDRSDGAKRTSIGGWYIFGVEGSDESGNTVDPSGNGYGFRLVTTGAAPVLEASFSTSEDNATWTAKSDSILYLKSGTYVKIKGTVSVEDGKPNLRIKLDGSTEDLTPNLTKVGDTTYEFTKEYEPSDFGSRSAQHTIVLTAEQIAKTEKSYTILYDLEGPVVSISEVSPIASKYNDDESGTTDGFKYLNGDNVSIKISVTDSFDVVNTTDTEKLTKIEILDKDGNPVRTQEGITTPANYIWTGICTKTGSPAIPEDEITIRITAYDRAGNETVATNKTVANPCDYYVNQETDKPVILPNSSAQLSFKVPDRNSLNSDTYKKKNRFSSGSQLILKLIDDDGLASVTPYYGTTETTLTPQPSVSLNASSTNEIYSYNLPTDAGYHYLKFELADIYNNITSTPTFLIKITANAPAIDEVTSVVKEKDGAVWKTLETAYTKGATGDDDRYFENTITITSDYTKFNIYRSTDGVNFTQIKSGITLTNGSYTDSDELRPQNTTTYQYRVAGVDEDDGSENFSNIKTVTCKVDKTAPSVILKALPGKEDTKASSYTFSGTAKDTGGSGVAKVEVTITDPEGPTKTVTASDTTSWACDVTYLSFDSVFTNEGYKTIFVKAFDEAGNESSLFTFGNVSDYNNSTKTLTFLYDKADPVLTVSAGRKYMPVTGYNLSGTATDSCMLDKLIIKEYKDGNETAASGAQVTVNTDGSWTQKIPLGNVTPSDGTYKYTLILSDKKGNTVSDSSVESVVDTTPPLVTIRTPSSDTLYKGTKAITEDKFRFDGVISETNSMSGVYYYIAPNGGAAPDTPAQADLLSPAAWTSPNGNYFTVDSYGTTSWNTEPELQEGINYNLYVYAVDEAGNLSSVVSRSFDVDKAAPSVTTKINDKELTTAVTEISTLASYQFKYKATDTLGLDAANPTTLAVKKDGAALAAGKYTDILDSDGFHIVTLASGAEDGDYSYTVTATDKVGKTTTVTRTIRLDTKGPDISFNTNFEGYQESAGVTVKGNADDATGVHAIYYAYGVAAAPAIPDSNVLVDGSWTSAGQGWQKASGTTNWNFTINGNDADHKKLFVCAVDTNGIVSNIIEESVKFDLIYPSLTETNIGSVQKITNYQFVLSGKVYDTNGIKSLSVTEGQKTYTLANPSDAASFINYKDENSPSWSVTFNVGSSNSSAANYLTDGTHSFTIIATDDAGKQTKITRSVLVDTVAPSELVLKALPTIQDTLNNQMTLSGTSVDATSGVAKVEVTITDVSESAATTPAIFTAEATGTGNWYYMLEYASEALEANWKDVFASEGKKKITLKVTDAAGNSTSSFKVGSGTPVTEAEFIYDKKEPVLTVSNAAGLYATGGSKIEGTASDTYKLGTLQFILNDSDPQNVSDYDPSANPKNAGWTLTIPDSDGTYKYKFILKDSVGHTVNSEEITKIVDTKAPKIKNENVSIGGKTYDASNWYNSKTINIVVEAEDEGDSGMNLVEYSTDNTNWTALTPAANTNKYSGPVVFSEAGKGKTLTIRATDKAGNIKYFDGETENGKTTDSSITINIDVGTPDVSAKYFKIGDADVKAAGDTIYVNNDDSTKVTLYGDYKATASGVIALDISGIHLKENTNIDITYSTTELTSESVISSATFAALPEDSSEIKSWKAEFIPDGEENRKITLKGKNKAGTERTYNFYITRDVTAPKIPNLSFVDSNDIAQYKAADGKYFINNKSKTFKFSGTTSDKYGVAKVEISGGVTKGTTAIINEGPNEDWLFSGLTVQGTDNVANTITIRATDNAGNFCEKSVPVIIDTTAPTGVHLLDATDKDIFFRIGNQNRDEGVKVNADGSRTIIEKNEDETQTNTNSPAWSTDDEQVGGKYSGGSFGNAQTIMIRGTFVDVIASENNLLETTAENGTVKAPVTGSGIKMIYYDVTKIAPSASSAADLATLAKTVKDKNKTISPKSETKRVFFTSVSNKISGTSSNNITKSEIVPKTVSLTAGTTDYVSLYDKLNNSTTKKYWKNIESTFSETIGGFTSGENYLVLVAEDNAGNYAVDYVKVGSSEYNNFSINVDQINPEIKSENRFENTIYTNRVTPTRISGIAEDKPTDSSTKDASGIKNIVITVNGKDITTTDSTYGTLTLVDSGTEKFNGEDVTCTKYKTKWTVEIKANTFPTTSGNISVYATVTDCAGTGNTQKVSVATVNVDTDPPSSSINIPDDADKETDGTQVNGTISLSGSASDTNGINRIVGLLYKVDNTATTMSVPDKDTSLSSTDELNTWTVPSGWTKVDTTITTQNNNTSWTASGINTAKLDGTAEISDGSKVWFAIAVQDNAGNIGFSILKGSDGNPVPVIVDQDTDRPVIKLTTLTLTSDMGTKDSNNLIKTIGFENSSFQGVLSDDDGIPKAMAYRIGSSGDFTDSAAAGSSLTYSATDGQFTLRLPDGQKEVYFQITDVKDKTFETKVHTGTVTDASLLLTPKLTDNAGTKYAYKGSESSATQKSSVIYITVDTTPPTARDVKYSRDANTWASEISTEYFGGTSNLFYLQEYAYDINGVKKVYLSIPVDNNTDAAKADGTSTAVTAWVYNDTTTNKTLTIYTNGNKPAAGADYWTDYDTSVTKTGTIDSAASDNITITVSDKTYTRSAYIFPLEKTATKSGDFDLWQTPSAKPVNVANLISSSRNASLITSDGIKTASSTLLINIDNTPPVITFNGPSDSKQSGSVTVHGIVDCNADVYYAVSTCGDFDADGNPISPDSSTDVTTWLNESNVPTQLLNSSLKNNTEKYTVGTVEYKYYQYKKIDDASLSWFVYFDEDKEKSTEPGEHQQILNNYLVKYGVTTAEKLAAQDENQFGDLVKLYIWIKAVDERGNVTEKPKLVLLDPQGDRPEVKFSYPLDDGKTYGGNVQITGSATDKIGSATDGSKTGIESVWAQIISTKHGSDTTTGYGSFTTDATTKEVKTFTINKNDLDYLKDKYDIYNMKTYHNDKSQAAYSGTIAEGYSASDYAIRINPEGASWNQTINDNKEFDVSSGTNGIAIRIYSQDKDGKFSSPVDRYMIFDAQNPIIGSPQSLYLIQSESDEIETSGTGDSAAPKFKETASKEYVPDMFVRGQWYLIGSVNDNDKIKILKIDGKEIVKYSDNNELTAPDTDTDTAKGFSYWTSKDKSTVYFKYKLSTSSGVGALAFKIEVTDQATPNAGYTPKEISIKYDNTAPLLAGAGDSAYKISPVVKQSNGFYKFESKITEDADSVTHAAQSGFDFVAFYFMRRNTKGSSEVDTEVDTIYNPMLASSNSVTVNAATPLMGAAAEADDTIVYDSGLYWIKKTVTRSTSLNQLGVASSEDDMYIRKNGLVKIGGTVYKITEKSTAGITLNGNPPKAKAEETAYFALALLSDHTSPESGSTGRNPTTGYPLTITNDDGDGFVDYVEKSGTSWTWSAEIVSKNIPDGPIELHYVAFDQAGNYSIGIMGSWTQADFNGSSNVQTPDRSQFKTLYSSATRTSNVLYVDKEKSYYNGTASDIRVSDYNVSAMVQNNAPRLAAVKIWTDYNGNDSEDVGEYQTKYCNEKQYISGSSVAMGAGGVTSTFVVSGNGKDFGDSGTAYMTIRDKTVFTPEIVGGNGTLNYQRRIGKASDLSGKAWTTLSSNWITGTNVQVESDDYMTNNGVVDTTKTRSKAIVFAEKKSDGSDSDDWDNLIRSNSTNDTDPYWFEYKIWDSTDGTTPGTDSLSAVMRIALNVQYFDETDPSAKISPFFWNNKDENSLAWDEEGTALGHIELENNLTDTIKNITIGSVKLGSDPKVSGKIIVSGEAFDNIRLGKLYARFTDHKGLSDYTLIAEYNGTWDNKSGDGWSASVEDISSNASGHRAKWSVTLDTAQVAANKAVTGIDREFTVYAVDARGASGGNTSQSSLENAAQTAEGAETPYYKMDVVPYVTKVETSLSKNKITNWSVYNRTALGHYPVQSVVSNIESSIKLKTTTSEDVILHGFNLNSDTATIVSGGNTFTVGNTNTALQINNSTAGQLKFNVANLASGKLNLTVNGLALMNNINDNDAWGSAGKAGTAYANCYNRQPNGDTNNNLTDDIVFDVWEFNDRAAVPINGLAAGINMEVNQVTGMLNYAFANGGLYFSMGGNTDKTKAYSATNSYSSYYWAGDWDTFAGPCVGFHVDELGYTYSLDSGGDTNTNGSVDKWVLYSSRWGEGYNSGEDAKKGTLNGYNSLRLEEIGYRTGTGDLDYSMMKYRFLSPEFASTVDKTNDTTNLYLVYYDALCNQIRFRAGSFNKTSKQTNGGFQDQYTTGASTYYNTNNCQIIANGSQNATFKTSATETKTVASISRRGSGQYVDVAVVKDGTNDVVCVVWYDVGANNMKYSYITNPIGQWNSLKGNETAAGWSTPKPIFTEGGEYCHIVADKNNHLHIAAYAGNGDVKYAYLDTYSSDASICTVDSSGSVGEHLTLDVAVNSKNHSIPYIGYYTSAIKKPKYAYLVDPTVDDSTATFTQVAAGTDAYERFTGKWEVAVVPTPSTMTTNREDKVNCGVWKSAGVLTDSKVGSAVKNSSTGGTFNGYSSTNWSKTFGNGTSNGVLGYQITSATGTCLETAQMR